jgi:chemotaxis protein MotB
MADRPPPEEGPAGAPKWMVTFSDCMTLLLTFFVLLLSFSSFDNKTFYKATTSLAQALPSISVSDTRNRNSVIIRNEIMFEPERSKGSEFPTDGGTKEANAKESSDTVNFNDRKVFLIQSDKIFVRQSPQISPDGKSLLKTIAQFLKSKPNRIVISESQVHSAQRGGASGIKRAFSVMNFLVRQGSLSLDRFAISGTSTVPPKNLSANMKTMITGRLLEIVLLDKSICQ